jgi:molybdate transport repressor ModE-like protein
MTISLEGLAVIDAIERNGSFAQAARELGKVPSAVTYMVRQLEDQFDALLFDRRGHRAVLTDAGKAVVREGRELLRAADELERRIARVATGWEVELRIAMDGMLRSHSLLALAGKFYQQQPGTRLRMVTEVLSGTTDALHSGRADLALGIVQGSLMSSATLGGFQIQPLGSFEMVFAVAPHHPLATANEPISADVIRRHRAVAVADSARNLPAITVGLLRGQDVLTVSSMQDKIEAHVSGLGCGHLALGWALPHLRAGRLVAKLTAEPRLEGTLYYAWPTKSNGRALRWFVDQLADPSLRASLMP